MLVVQGFANIVLQMSLKRFPILILTVFILNAGYSQTRIISYNIRYDNPSDGENWWENRKSELVELIEFYNPDFIGIQEGMNNQVDFLNQYLDDYTYIGIGRDGEGSISEAVPIFFDTTKYDLIENRTFWLSETPNLVSKGWDAALNRISTYGAFKNKITADTLFLFNCHFDHIGEIARKNSAQVIIQKMKEFELMDKQVIVMGDLNCEPTEDPYKILSEYFDDGMSISKKKMYGPEGTWNGFDREKIISRRIDYIFSQGLSISSYRHIDDRRKNNLHISDHLPVMIELE